MTFDLEDMEVAPPPPRGMRVDLMGHCSICLRRGRADDNGDNNLKGCQEDPPVAEGSLSGLPSSSSSSGITSFHHIWPYLMDDKRKAEEVAGAKFILTDTDTASDLPPICQACEEKVRELYRLHWELQAKVEEIKKVIKDTGGGGIYFRRSEGFEERLRRSSNLEGQERMVQETLRFLEYILGTALEWIEGVQVEAQSQSCQGPVLVEDPGNGDWKLKTSPVVSLAPVSLSAKPDKPKMETDDNHQHSSAGMQQRRRGKPRPRPRHSFHVHRDRMYDR